MSNQSADDSPLPSQAEGETSETVQLAQERVEVAKQRVGQGRVTVTRRTTEREEAIEEWLKQEKVEIHRVVKGTPLDAHPAIREKDGVMIIPVVDEHIEVVRTAHIGVAGRDPYSQSDDCRPFIKRV